MRWAIAATGGTPQLVSERMRPLIRSGGLRANLLPLATSWQRRSMPGTHVAFVDLETCDPAVWAIADGEPPERDVWNVGYAIVTEPDDVGMIKLRLTRDNELEDWFPSCTIFVAGLPMEARVQLKRESWQKSPDRARAALRSDQRMVMDTHNARGPICYWRP